MIFLGYRLVFHGSRWVFMVFHGSRWIFMVFHDSRLIFHSFSWSPVGFRWVEKIGEKLTKIEREKKMKKLGKVEKIRRNWEKM